MERCVRNSQGARAATDARLTRRAKERVEEKEIVTTKIGKKYEKWRRWQEDTYCNGSVSPPRELPRWVYKFIVEEILTAKQREVTRG